LGSVMGRERLLDNPELMVAINLKAEIAKCEYTFICFPYVGAALGNSAART